MLTNNVISFEQPGPEVKGTKFSHMTNTAAGMSIVGNNHKNISPEPKCWMALKCSICIGYSSTIKPVKGSPQGHNMAALDRRSLNRGH